MKRNVFKRLIYLAMIFVLVLTSTMGNNVFGASGDRYVYYGLDAGVYKIPVDGGTRQQLSAQSTISSVAEPGDGYV